MGKIIAIEGVCCSGKSTLVNQLSNMGLETIKEYGDYTNGQFPKLATSIEGLVKNTKFFIELERRRYRDSLTIVDKNQPLVLDRSFITCCAFDHAAFMGTGLSIYQPAVEGMWQREDKKLTPDLMIILEVDSFCFRQRLNASGKVLNKTLCNPKFNQKFNKYLSNVYTHWGIQTLQINTSNLNPGQVLSQVLDSIIRLSKVG